MIMDKIEELECHLLDMNCTTDIVERIASQIWPANYDILPCLKNFTANDWLITIQNSALTKIFCTSLEKFDHDPELYPTLESSCLLSLRNYICEAGISNRMQCEIEVLILGVSCLHLFTQLNWTGPPFKYEERLISPLAGKTTGDALINLLNDRRGGCATVIECGSLLWIAVIIFLKARGFCEHLQLMKIWTIKCLCVLQEVLDEASPIIQSAFSTIREDLPGQSEIPSYILGPCYLDCMHLSLKYYEYDKAKKYLEDVCAMQNMDISLSGVLGKRTKFQRNELAQLKLSVEMTKTDDATHKTYFRQVDPHHLPKDVRLDNDTLLPEIKYSDVEIAKNISPLEQAIVVSSCCYLKRTKPRDKLTAEELLPFVEHVLKDPKSWSVQYRALYLRSILERDSSRRVERAMTQLEELVSCCSTEDPEPFERISLLSSVGLPPRWVCEANLGKLLMSLGCFKSALDIFLRIQAWDDVVQCHTSLGNHEKAKNILLQQLAVQVTPKLYCLLGDVTNNTDYYEKAIEVSKGKYSNAHASLGLWYMRNGKLEECIPLLERSLFELNYLQPSIWFSLGFAAITTKKYDVAAKAYQHAVQVDPDNFEAWANLASSFIRINQKDKAFRALKEALRLSYENNKIWENYLLVSIDIGEFEEVIRASNRLLDLTPKHVDTEVLSVLCHAVLSDIPGRNGVGASSLMPKMKELFGRITSQVTSSSKVWELYGKLYSKSGSDVGIHKAYQFSTKALKCKIDEDTWKSNKAEVPQLVSLSQALVEVSATVVDLPTYQAQRTQLLAAPRMLIKNLLIMMQNKYPSELKEFGQLESCLRDLS